MKLVRPVLPAIAAAPNPVAPRFWSKVDRRGPDECWPWTAATYQHGYGNFRLNNSGYCSNRVAYALGHGVDPGGHFVLHRCDNPSCCNPAHLFLGTQSDNMVDMHRKGRHKHEGVRGERHVLSKLTREQVLAILDDPRSCQKVGAEYGVSSSTVHAIRKGRNWKHATEGKRRPRKYPDRRAA